jgi:hypothetical protein
MDAFRFGFTYPVETNLVYDNLDSCLKSEEAMRKEYAQAYSKSTWSQENLGQTSDPLVASRYGLKTTATCIPRV